MDGPGSRREHDSLTRIFEWCTRAVLLGVVSLMVWQVQALNSLSERVARLETANLTAFTARDGLEIWREISDIKEKVAKMPVEVPPEWFVSRIDRIDGALEKIVARISVLEGKSP